MQTFHYFANEGTYRLRCIDARPLGLDTGRPALCLDFEILTAEAGPNPDTYHTETPRAETGDKRSVYVPLVSEIGTEEHYRTVDRLQEIGEAMLPGIDWQVLRECERPATAMTTQLLQHARDCTPRVEVVVAKTEGQRFHFARVIFDGRPLRKARDVLLALGLPFNRGNTSIVLEALTD